MKKIFSLCLFGMGLIALASCNNSEVEEGKSFVSLDINPSVELIVEDGKVVNVYATNDDARVLIYDEELVGKDFETVVDMLIDLSVECGHLSSDNQVVDFSVSSSSEDLAAKLEGKIENIVVSSGEENGLELTFSTEGVFSLIRELDALKEEYKNNLEIQNLTVEEFKIISSAVESDEALSYEEAVKLSTDQLMNHITESRDELFNLATKTYNEMVIKTELAYEKALTAADRTIYSTYYLSNTLRHPVNYGLLYSMYGSAADTLEEIVKLTEVFNSYKAQALENETVQALIAELKELGIAVDESLSVLKDSEGNITLDSINTYLDKVIKNSNVKELEDLKNTLNSLESEVKTTYAKLREEYTPMLQSLVTVLEATKTQISALISLLPTSLKEILSTYIEELDTMTGILNKAITEGATMDDVNDWIKTFREKEEELLTKIGNDLSEEELAEVEQLKDKASTDITNAKTALDEAVEKAKAKVEEELAKSKK